MEAHTIEPSKRISLLDIPIDIVPEEMLEEILKRMITDKKKHQIVLISLWGLLKARGKGEFSSLAKEASLIIPTSKSIITGARFLKKETPIRYMPFNFVIRIMGVLEKYNHSVYLLGAKPDVLHIAASNLRTSFPGLRIVGRYAGTFKQEQEQDVILAIKKAAPTLLLVEQGPKGKDKWIYQKKHLFFKGMYLYCDNCFSIFAGKKKKIDNQSWEKGTYIIKEVIKKPWKIMAGFIYFYYALLLIIYRIKKK